MYLLLSFKVLIVDAVFFGILDYLIQLLFTFIICLSLALAPSIETKLILNDEFRVVFERPKKRISKLRISTLCFTWQPLETIYAKQTHGITQL